MVVVLVLDLLTTISTYVFISPETYWSSEIIQGDGGC